MTYKSSIESLNFSRHYECNHMNIHAHEFIGNDGISWLKKCYWFLLLSLKYTLKFAISKSSTVCLCIDSKERKTTTEAQEMLLNLKRKLTGDLCEIMKNYKENYANEVIKMYLVVDGHRVVFLIEVKWRHSMIKSTKKAYTVHTHTHTAFYQRYECNNELHQHTECWWVYWRQIYLLSNNFDRIVREKRAAAACKINNVNERAKPISTHKRLNGSQSMLIIYYLDNKSKIVYNGTDSSAFSVRLLHGSEPHYIYTTMVALFIFNLLLPSYSIFQKGIHSVVSRIAANSVRADVRSGGGCDGCDGC